MANEAQVDYWNGKAGDTWADAQERMDAMLKPISQAAINFAEPKSDERAIDIGCGCGETTLALNDLGLSVWGVDVSAPMLEIAKQRAQGRQNVAFSKADAASQNYTPDHQLVFSRFGVMFFDNPIAAFTNIKTALTPEGRLSFVCWQAPRHNAWVSLVGAAVQPLLPEPTEPVDPKAPGPFAFADRDYLFDLLEQAGFTNITIEPYEAKLKLASNLDDALRFQSEIGPMARVLAELSGEKQAQAMQAARSVLAQQMTDDGLHLGSATWLVSAT